MPKSPRPGTRALYVELDEDLYAHLENLAEANLRTMKAEVTAALRRHLAAGPLVDAETTKQPAKRRQKAKE